MTLLKTALGNLKSSPTMNIINFIQLIAVFLVTAVMVSAISIRYRAYDPIKDILSSKGFYADFDPIDGARKPDGIDMKDSIFSVEELNSYTNAESVICVKSIEAITIHDYPDIKSSVPTLLFYDDELIRRCKPALKAGRWISSDPGQLEAVITDDNNFGWKLGDTLDLELSQATTTRFIKINIVGIVEGSADIFGYNRARDATGDTFRYVYNTHNSKNEDNPGKPTIISSSKALERLFPDVEARIDAAFFTYGNDTPDELIKEKSRLAGRLNASVVIDLKTMNEKSRIYLQEELFKLMPVVVILLVLVVISAVSVSAIAVRRRLKDYAKYYILGLQWKQCAAVNLFQALITGAAALVVSAAVLFVISFTALSDVITIIVNARLIFALLGILLLYLAFSMIMPLLMLRSTTPKTLLQSE